METWFAGATWPKKAKTGPNWRQLIYYPVGTPSLFTYINSDSEFRKIALFITHHLPEYFKSPGGSQMMPQEPPVGRRFPAAHAFDSAPRDFDWVFPLFGRARLDLVGLGFAGRSAFLMSGALRDLARGAGFFAPGEGRGISVGSTRMNRSRASSKDISRSNTFAGLRPILTCLPGCRLDPAIAPVELMAGHDSDITIVSREGVG